MSSFPTPPENHNISLEKASAETRNYRLANPGKTIAFTIEVEDVLQVINQQGCTHITIYNSLTDKGEEQRVMVATDVNGNNLYNGVLKDHMYGTPPWPLAPNPLNT